jgi:hypothetical protein
MKKTESKRSVTRLLVVSSVIAALLLMVTNSAIWFNKQIFDSANFTNTAVTAVTSVSSRQAIGARITDELLANRPLVKNVAGDQITNVISGLLGTDQAERLLTAAVSRMQVYVTSSDQQDVAIDLSGIKPTISQIASVLNTDRANNLDTNKIPDNLVLVQAQNVPDLYSYGVVLSWLAPISAIGALALFALPYYKDRSKYKLILSVQAAAIAVAGLLSLLVGPLFRPMALQPFQNVNGRAVVANIYDAFIQTFNSQSMVLIYLGLLVGIVAIGTWSYPVVQAQIKKRSGNK